MRNILVEKLARWLTARGDGIRLAAAGDRLLADIGIDRPALAYPAALAMVEQRQRPPVLSDGRPPNLGASLRSMRLDADLAGSGIVNAELDGGGLR